MPFTNILGKYTRKNCFSTTELLRRSFVTSCRSGKRERSGNAGCLLCCLKKKSPNSMLKTVKVCLLIPIGRSLNCKAYVLSYKCSSVVILQSFKFLVTWYIINIYNNYFYEMAGCLNSAGNTYLHSRFVFNSKSHEGLPMFLQTLIKVIKPLATFDVVLNIVFLNSASCKGKKKKKGIFFLLLFLSEIVYFSLLSGDKNFLSIW